ncbi:TetR/AcrR family transcriptional regulator [Rhodoligotrophos defluvii]|uniref:TetR/AcrR family transcriptional regulator n=1 Tax=Rhodoligotrophos defluvii TaxID=2561934 RepID=UPI0010C9A141|nr:TetR/AcrR family transcriptional regulator [Rhodoligotrophos defluvii]
MARTQSQNYPEVRKNILKQAAALFAQKGYSGTTIVDLANACDASRGALYHYFDSKEEILFHLLDEHVAHLVDQLQSRLATIDDPLEQCRALISEMVLTNAESLNEQVVLLNHLNQLSPEQQQGIIAKQRKIIELAADILIRLDKQRRIGPRTKKVYTMMLFGIINYAHIWFDPKGAVSPQEYADMTSDLFLRGFTGS